MHMTEEDKLLGIGSVTMHNEYGVLEDILILDADQSLSYGMGKALLNFIDICGPKKVICENEALAPLLKRLGFKKNEDDAAYFLSLDNYFTKKCDC